MRKLSELLKEALAKQNKRFFLSSPEKEFIQSMEALLAVPNLSEIELISNMQMKLNLLITAFSSAWQFNAAFDDFIALIFKHRLELLKSQAGFNNNKLRDVEEFVKQKSYSHANQLLRIYFSQLEIDKRLLILGQERHTIDDSARLFKFPGTFHIKLLVTGPSASGASCCVSRYNKNRFDDDIPVTIGISFISKQVNVDENNFNLQIGDGNGATFLRKNFASSYLRGVHGCLLVFDLTQKETFLQLPRYLSEIRFKSTGPISIILVGNKLDDAAHREVNFNEANEFVNNNDLNAYLECSAKTGAGIEAVFETAVRFVGARSLNGNLSVVKNENNSQVTGSISTSTPSIEKK